MVDESSAFPWRFKQSGIVALDTGNPHDPPLERDVMSGEISIEQKVSVAFGRLSAAIKLFDPIEVFGLYSGGHDSFSACYVASLHPRFSGALHINTGIGVEETRIHVRVTCAQRSWKLHEYKAMENTNSRGESDPQDYEALVLAHGFPGPFHHGKMYNRLKERPMRCLERACGATPRHRVMYVSGCRSDESLRRMGNTEEVQPDGRKVWVAPCHDWSKRDTSDLIEFAKAHRNIVVDLIHKSGECLCGAYANKGELEELSLFPQTRPAWHRIVSLQKRVAEAGFPWGWEDAPPKEYLEEKRGQQFIPETRQFLCWSCNANRTQPTAMTTGIIFNGER